jgi:hypothetical protein
LKIQLSGGEPPLPPTQSDEVVILDSQLPEADEVVATVDEANTQKSKRKKRATQDESSLKKRAKKLKIVEDDPPPLASPEVAVASTSTLSELPALSRPPPPPILSSVRRPPVVSEFMLNSSIVHQRHHFQEISNFILSLPPSHPKRVLGVARSNVGMADLVIADIPKNLHVPNVSDPSYSVPSWNALDSDFLGEFFDFADERSCMTMKLSSSFILMTMVTSGRALKTISVLLGSRSSRSGWESTVFAYLQLSIRTRPPTSSMLYYLFVPPK